MSILSVAQAPGKHGGQHRLGEPGIHMRHLLSQHANVHVIFVMTMRRHFTRSRFGLRDPWV